MSSYLHVARDCMAYLHRPPPSSWVARVAASFRVLALILIVPCVLLTALDVASYLIVRTLGADSAHRLAAATAPPYGASAAPSAAGVRARQAPAIVLAAGDAPHHDMCFATPPESNPALSGEGIFSPPQSRSSSPPAATRSSRKTPVPASLAMTETDRTRPDGDNAAALRKRGHAEN